MVKEMEVIKLEAQRRVELGSSAVNRLRRAGWLPAVVYDSNGKSQPVQFNRHAFELMVRRHGGQNLVMDMQLDGAAALKVLLKDVQRDCIRDHMLHVDLLEISMTRKLRIDVALRLVGEPQGVTQQGGILEQLLRTVQIECLPADIIQELPLDVSALNLDESLFVRDLKTSPAHTVLTAGHIAVASVHLPAAEEEVKPAEEEAAAEGAAPAEGEAAAKAEGAAEGKPAKDGKEPAKDAKPAAKDAKPAAKEADKKDKKEKK